MIEVSFNGKACKFLGNGFVVRYSISNKGLCELRTFFYCLLEMLMGEILQESRITFIRTLWSFYSPVCI